ncbi:MAG: sulfotransferase [Salinibacter sp.]
MEVPDIIVIGAPRSGTTSLYRYLDEHPEVYMSPLKETRFFAYEGQTVDYDGPADAYAYNRDTVTDAAAYRQLFADRTPGQRTGEATPVYLYRGDRAAERIQRHAPDARLVAIFRNPVERAYSDFLNMVRLGWEPVHDFEQALAREEARIGAHWSPYYHYQAKGFYADQVRTYLRRFDREQMKFFLFEDLKRDAAAVMEDLFSFVGVDPSVSVGTETRHNRSGLPRSSVAHRLLTHPLLERVMRGPLRPIRTTLRDWNTAHEKPRLDPEVRADLRETYRDDIQDLQKVIGRDLSHWLS